MSCPRVARMGGVVDPCGSLYGPLCPRPGGLVNHLAVVLRSIVYQWPTVGLLILHVGALASDAGREAMYALRDTADSMPVTDDVSRGSAIQNRLTALGISDREFQERAGVDRKTLRKAIADLPSVRDNTYRVIESWLDREEAKHAGVPESDPGDDLIEFRLSGNFGVDVVVKGPIRDRGQLEDAVVRLIREMRGTGGAN